MELFQDIHSGCEADLFQPLKAYIYSKQSGRNTAPYIPKFKEMSVHKLCELALLWFDAGFEREARELANWLLPLENFLTLWSPEKEFKEVQARQSFLKLKQIEPIGGKAPECDLTLYKSGDLEAAFTLSGNGSALGIIRNSDIEIRALGPQGDSLEFGIKGRGMNRWARCFALPEVWFESKIDCIDSQIKLDLRFVGLQPKDVLSFAFYVKAQSCQVGKEVLKPKSLRRFSGETSRVQLNQTLIESSAPHKVEIIPLAGEGCFWDCEFLVSFEVPAWAPQLNFLIKK